MQNSALMTAKTGKLQYKFDGNYPTYPEGISSIVNNNERRYQHLLKWLHDRRNELGVVISANIKNYVEVLEYKYADKAVISNIRWGVSGTSQTINLNNSSFYTSIKRFDKVKKLKDVLFEIQDCKSYSGNLTISLQVSVDNINWENYVEIYKTGSFSNTSVDQEGRVVPQHYQVIGKDHVDCPDHYILCRIKAHGTGTMVFHKGSPFVMTSNGTSIVAEEYKGYTDQEDNIGIEKVDSNEINFSRTLEHSKRFTAAKTHERRNPRQTIELLLSLPGGKKSMILQETYTSNFISNILLLPAVDTEYYTFINNGDTVPIVGVNSKIKQVLNKTSEGIYVNKRLISRNVPFTEYGFALQSGIGRYASEGGRKPNNVITDLNKLSVKLTQETLFSDLNIDYGDHIGAEFRDVNNNLVIKGGLALSDLVTLGDTEIMEKITKHKSPHHISIITYNTLTPQLEKFIDLISEGTRSPNTVVLVTDTPDSSKTSEAVLDKLTLGKTEFKRSLKSKIEENYGLRASSTTNIVSEIATFINDAIRMDKYASCHNMVGINIYDFSNTNLDTKHINKYGYFINEQIKVVEITDGITFLSRSENNSSGKMQIDIGSQLKVEYDTTPFSDDMTITAQTETAGFPGESKPYDSFTLIHNENTMYDYIVGSEEILVNKNKDKEALYISTTDPNRVVLHTSRVFDESYRGENSVTFLYKKNGIITGGIKGDFLVDYAEPVLTKFELDSVDAIGETGYRGKTEIEYTKDNFLQVSMNLNGMYQFLEGDYKLVLYHEKNPDYKIERPLEGRYNSKIFTFHFDDIKEVGEADKIIKFGKWKVKLMRNLFDVPIAEATYKVPLNLKEALLTEAKPVEYDHEDIENDGLQKGKDVYVDMSITGSEYFKNTKDIITFAKEVRFMNNNVNFTLHQDCFTFRDEVNGSLDFTTNHQAHLELRKRNQLRWFLSGNSDEASNQFLKKIANLDDGSKKTKNIKIAFVLYSGEIIETNTVEIGKTGNVPTPILLGTQEHRTKLILTELSSQGKGLDKNLTDDEIEKIEEEWKELGSSNYSNQQTIVGTRSYVFYSDLSEFKFDFGIAEYYTISQANNTTELIPITKDGTVRYVMDEKAMDEKGKGYLVVKGYVKLSDGTVNSSSELVVTIFRKRKPSLVQTGEDYTKYVIYEEEEGGNCKLNTVIQSRIVLENLNGTYDDSYIGYVRADLVDVDRKTSIMRGPDVEFYKGFVPQRFIFDRGLSSDDIRDLEEVPRVDLGDTKKYKETEEILNEKIFSQGKQYGQVFFLRFKAVEKAKDYDNKDIEIIGKETFYPVHFTEKLDDLKIFPSTGIVTQDENYYTYKDKVAVVLESNNAEYFMYRTDRRANFQTLFPKRIGLSNVSHLALSTYDVGEHILEVKQKAEGEPESNVTTILIEKLEPIYPPRITGDRIEDQDLEWSVHPVDGAAKLSYSISTESEDHTNKEIKSKPYEVTLEPETFLGEGYHILRASVKDKIGTESEDSFFVTEKIGRPVASDIVGNDVTSDPSIVWKWASQYDRGIVEYLAEVNGVEKIIVPASKDGFNKMHLRHFQGEEIKDGNYELRLWAINKLGNRSYKYSSYATTKGSLISELVVEMDMFYANYVNNLNAKIVTDDPAMAKIEYQIFKSEVDGMVDVSGPMETSYKQLPFLKSDGERLVLLEDGEYSLMYQGVNFVGRKTEQRRITFNFKKSLPKTPHMYYPRVLRDNRPVIFAKPVNLDPIKSIELKINDGEYEVVRNNAWKPNYSINNGVNNLMTKVTDYAGNVYEFSDFIDVAQNGVNMFQDDLVVDMNNPVVNLDFNLPEMVNFGHSIFKVEQKELGVSVLVNIKDAKEIEIPLTQSQEDAVANGIYTFVVKLFDDITQDYTYIADVFNVTIDSEKPSMPYFLNASYSQKEKNIAYTKNRQPKWMWQTRQDLDDVKEYRVTLEKFSEEENKYIEYGNGQYNDYSTKLVGSFDVPTQLVDGTYKLIVNVIGKNSLVSEPVSFIYVIKNNAPRPPKFNLNSPINKKYENRSRHIMWTWESDNVGRDEIVAYKVKINDLEFTQEMPASNTFYEVKNELSDGANTIIVVGKDKAGNWSSSNISDASNYGSEYMYHTKILDTTKPEKIGEEDVEIIIDNSKSFEVFFSNDEKVDEYFLFELFTLDDKGNEQLMAKGNTLPENFAELIYFQEQVVKSGIEIGKREGEKGYAEIRDNSTDGSDNDISLYFTNLLPNEYFVRIYGIDYAGSIGLPLVKEVLLEDKTQLKPSFISPTQLYTNNNTIIFQWVLQDIDIKEWEYQLATPYNQSSVDLVGSNKWKTLDDNSFKLNNIPKNIGGNDADGDYTFYVRAVFNEMVSTAGTGEESNKRSDISSITVHLDRSTPQGIAFTNKPYTDDNTLLRWTWDYTGDGDTASGVHWTLEPTLPIDEWNKLEAAKELTLFQERADGAYTIYIRTFDMAGNVNGTTFKNTIVIDRKAPFKPLILGGSHIFTNKIPTVSWENDVNYYRYTWLIMAIGDFENFKAVYDEIIHVENYTLSNDDWSYIFGIDYAEKGRVHPKLKELDVEFKKNDPITENFITVNSTPSKNGIESEGEYVFLLGGYNTNMNWAEAFEYQFITYDMTAPNLDLIKFTSPTFTITEERRPTWVWDTPSNVVKCEYVLEKNGYADGSVAGTLTDTSKENKTWVFTPSFNLSQGNYRLIVNCYDASGNFVQISKAVTIENESTYLETIFFDIVLPGNNNKIRGKKEKYSDTYVIIDIDIDKDSVMTYRDTSISKEFVIYEIGKTPLSLKGEYEFNIITYKLDSN